MEEVPEGGCDSVVVGATEVADGTEVTELRDRGVLSATMNCAKGGRGWESKWKGWSDDRFKGAF